MNLNDNINIGPYGFVKLINVMGNDSSPVQAARISYGDGTKSVREDISLTNYLLRNQHTSPFEQIEFQFHIKLPIFLARQWVRHRMANINEVSARYSEMKDEFWLPKPEELRTQDSKNKQAGSRKLPQEAAEQAVELIKEANKEAYERYKDLLDLGVCREQARAILPVSLYTEFYWKIDGHNLMRFLKLRGDSHAQKEIQDYAVALEDIFQSRFPNVFNAYVNYVRDAETFSETERNLISLKLRREDFTSSDKPEEMSQNEWSDFLLKLCPDYY